MAQMKVIIQDQVGAKKTPVELPDDAPMSGLLRALVTKMNLPTMRGGQPITYVLDHKRSGRRLRDEDTLKGAGVQADDVLALLPQVTAG
ncbi:MAG TPA: EsaB/YukD family protein [Anaerolineae bacterium]|nr:EsaB/YukD family protein [Anaerolineae bacterium]